jgi:hypothetical protein
MEYWLSFNVKEPTLKTSTNLATKDHEMGVRLNQAGFVMKLRRISILIQQGRLR